MEAGASGGQDARQDDIVQRVRTSGEVAVRDLAEHFGVTTETIRRDLTELQSQRLLRRVHGGAVPWDGTAFEPELSQRDTKHVAQKRRIATATIEQVPPAGTVILDSGSTTRFVADYFPRDRQLQVITNSVSNALVLAEHDQLEVVVLGGRVRRSTFAVTDSSAIDTLRDLRVDLAILGTDGISAEHGLTTPYHDEASIKGAMAAAARRVVVVADSSKFGDEHIRRFATFADVDTLITDDGADADQVQAIRAQGTSVVLA